MVGHKLKDGDRILIIEDVITAGTAIRESLPILMAAADIRIEGLVVSVDRMERGTGNSTAIKEIYEEFGIPTYAIVSVRDIIDTLYGREIGGRILIDGRMKERMEAYLTEYCVL